MRRGKPLAGFQADLRRFSDLLGTDVARVRRKIAMDLHRKITERTPVDTGRARASWMLADGQPPSGTADEGQRSPQAATQEALGQVSGSFSSPFGVAWIVNNLPYIEGLEFGHSQQAPNGMVRVALAEVEADVRFTMERLR